MSRFGRNARRTRQATARKAARRATRALGCRCDLEIRLRGTDRFRALHDHDCPLVDAPATWVIYADERCGR